MKSRTIHVVKRDGRIEEFNSGKIRKTILKAGIDGRTASRIMDRLEKSIYDGITTDEILEMALDLLGREKGIEGKRYDLKRSLYRLGPDGFEFERFVARLLEEHGFRVATNCTVEGRCVEHEIDVIAEKDGKSYLVECKFHNIPVYTGLKEVMYTHARFLDIGKFDGVWLVTNTKFSEDAKKYADCQNIRLTGWSYPENEGIEQMLVSRNLFPVTVLDVEKEVIDRLVMAGYVFCRDVVVCGIKGLVEIGLKKRDAERLILDAKSIIYGSG